MKTKHFRTIGFVFIVLFILGTLFRISHWPYGKALSFIGSIGATISFISYYLLKPKQSFYDRAALALTPVVFAFLVLKSVHPSYQSIYLLVAVLISVSFVIYWLIKFLGTGEKIKLGEMNWERLFYAIGAVAVIVGMILKYKHLPNARFFLLGGIVTMALSYLIGLFSKKSLED